MRIAGGIIAGVLTAFATILLVEWLGHLVFPFPSDAALANPETGGSAIAAIPVGAKLIVVIGWFAGALDGGFVAASIARARATVWLVAAIVAGAGIVNILMIPHPVWMQLAAVIAPLLGGVGANHLASLGGAARGRSDAAA